ncbi:MAG: hypothetical protein ACOYKD_07025 [Anaerolineaceae bacterium]|jgi:hypothetical protein
MKKMCSFILLIVLVSCMPKRLPVHSEPISITFTDEGEVDFNALYEIVEKKVTSVYKNAYLWGFNLTLPNEHGFRLEKAVARFEFYQKTTLFGIVTDRKLIFGAVDLEKGLVDYYVYNENSYIIEDPVVLDNKNAIHGVLNVISPVLQNNQKDMKSEVSITLLSDKWSVTQSVFTGENFLSYHAYELNIDTLTIRESNK